MRRRGRISLPSFIGCLIVVRNYGIFLRFVRLFQLGCINEGFVIFELVPVLRRQVVVCIALIFRPYVVRPLFVGLAVNAISDSADGDGNGFDVGAVDEPIFSP